ncbi:phasin family protein [Methylobacterium nigriterrae]|uniref:phasin family protein n=1 Tax=Methylobacterium nigriterrae TaxID=3127512 RepID=UPI00301342A0
MPRPRTPHQNPQSRPADGVGAAIHSDIEHSGVATWRFPTVDCPLRLTVEMTPFASLRRDAQAGYLRALGRCRSISDVSDLQSAVLSQAVPGYRTETTTLSRDIQDGIRA